MVPSITRRQWFSQSASGLIGGMAAGPVWSFSRRSHAEANSDVVHKMKLPVAAIVTTYYPHSHADVMVTKILQGFQHDGQEGPGLKLMALYVDQQHPQGMERELAQKHQFHLASSIDDALTLGTDKLQVAGVLSIGEHGDYPYTLDTHQKMYPRRRFFDGIVKTFERCGESVPVFNDKHLSYRWDDAQHMVATARRMGFPLLAGSSLPVAWRYPALELPLGCKIESALAVGYGPLEDYGFHALETLQCMIERRAGGESGVTQVRAVRGAAVRAAQQAGQWSQDLLAHALAQAPQADVDVGNWQPSEEAAAFLMQHGDGLKSAVIMANGLTKQFCFAAKLQGVEQPVAAWFKLQDGRHYGHFAYLVHAAEQTFRRRSAVYPTERTLLTTGILDRALHSLSQGGQELATPELSAVKYQAVDWPFANHPQSFMTMESDA